MKKNTYIAIFSAIVIAIVSSVYYVLHITAPYIDMDTKNESQKKSDQQISGNSKKTLALADFETYSAEEIADMLKGTYRKISISSSNGATINADISDSQLLQYQGLSGRTELLSGTGMLFIFPENGQYRFWMKDMKFSIDMIWLDENKKIVYIKEHAIPESYPEAFGPLTPTRYVLEIPDGKAKVYKFELGQTLAW